MTFSKTLSRGPRQTDRAVLTFLFFNVNELNMKSVRLLFTGLLAASALAFSPLSQAQMSGQW